MPQSDSDNSFKITNDINEYRIYYWCLQEDYLQTSLYIFLTDIYFNLDKKFIDKEIDSLSLKEKVLLKNLIYEFLILSDLKDE